MRRVCRAVPVDGRLARLLLRARVFGASAVLSVSPEKEVLLRRPGSEAVQGPPVRRAAEPDDGSRSAVAEDGSEARDGPGNRPIRRDQAAACGAGAAAP